jgi:hypothetical protein
MRINIPVPDKEFPARSVARHLAFVNVILDSRRNEIGEENIAVVIKAPDVMSQ